MKPYGYMNVYADGRKEFHYGIDNASVSNIPLYTAPRELSDLTEQVKALQAIGGYWYDGQVRNQYIADTCFELTKIINEAILKKASEE